jgi:hypothetical protein
LAKLCHLPIWHDTIGEHRNATVERHSNHRCAGARRITVTGGYRLIESLNIYGQNNLHRTFSIILANCPNHCRIHLVVVELNCKVELLNI